MTPDARPGDALLVVDLQNDFVTGSLAVPGGAEIVAPLNRVMATFAAAGRPVFVTRDWHPPGHCSFRAQGGPWPIHCVAGSEGAAFVPDLALPPGATIISKATRQDREAYSTFEDTDLDARLRQLGVRRLFIGGIATDYCVLQTVLDARRLGYEIHVLADAIRAVDAQPGDGERALQRMREAGAAFDSATEPAARLDA